MYFLKITEGAPQFYVQGMKDIPDGALTLDEATYLSAITAINGGGSVNITDGELIITAPEVAPTTLPPITVSPWQIRKALNETGKRQAVEDAVANSNDQTLKDGWAVATTFIENEPFVMTMASALSMTDDERHALFELAATL